MKRLLLFVPILCSLSLFSCSVSKATYLGSSDYSPRVGSALPDEAYRAENINGLFTDAVYIKTKTQTFNLYHYYILHNGRIWYKSIDPEQEPKKWTLFAKTGLPRKVSAITELSADADELVALSADGNFYRYCFDVTIAHRSNAWLDRQGWPVEEQLYFDSRTAQNRAWAVGKRNSHVLYYEDIFGNQHHNGTMEIVTTYVLLQDGQEICYSDPGLPTDFSRNYIGPERGTFIATSLSASASTMFVIGEAGEMYTRLVDFDTIGCDPMWFKYTYVPYTSDLPGTDYFSNLNEWALPSEDWRSQPGIPLAGKAAVTRHITILQNGQGNGARELRVAGLDEEGRSGYWSKQIFDDRWEFKTAPLLFAADAILVTAETAGEKTRAKRGPSVDKSYSGYRWNGDEQEQGWEYHIANFNILEGDCDFRISWQGETCTLKLHPVEMWTYLKRDYLPGRTGSPKMFLATLEVPENAFESLSDDFVRQVTEQYAQYDKVLFQFTITASHNYLIVKNTDMTGAVSNNALIVKDINTIDPVLFLTDGTVSDRYSESHIARQIGNHGEVERYYSPELTVSNTAMTKEALTEKFTLNRRFINELNHTIRVLRWSQLTAFKFNAGYLPAHYIIIFTPLRFIDVPKIRTVTSFGATMITANSVYVYQTTEARIRLLEKIIEMTETRILCYNNLGKKFSDNTVIPSWYSDNISDYWDIAGLPHTVSGTFFTPGIQDLSVQTPAVLSFVPPAQEQVISGWFFAIGESDDFSIFIESNNSAKAIYSRSGKTPQERKLQIDCTVYINDTANAPMERDIIERCLLPYTLGTNTGIAARIIFDGRTFEIRQHPAVRGTSPIFQGTL